jgi:peptidyl-prolyl cis-trans isomerase D
MFNLFRSRDKSVRWLLTGLLVVVAASMVTYLIPGSGSGFGGAEQDQTVVATIGKETVTTQDVRRQIQSMTQNRQLPPELLSIYTPQIVKQMIDERAMAYEANRLGLKVSAAEANDAIVDSLPPQLVKDGKVDGATLTAMLQQQGLTLEDLRSTTARQMLVSRLEQIVSEGVVVSPAEIENEFRKRNAKVKLDYALVTPAKYQADAEPTEAEMKAYYDAHKADFKVPEKRSFGIVMLDPQKIAAGIQPTDAQLQALYTSQRNNFQTPERVKVRHILLKADATNEAQVKPKAEALLKQIQGGGDFAKLAKDNSQDPGSGAQGGELGYIVKGQTVPEFERAAFTLGVGQTSGLVRTTYGFHILQVEAHEQARLQPFDEVKPQLIDSFQKQAANQQLQNLADKAIAELRKDPLHPEKAADAVGGTVIRAENVQAGDPIPGVGASKDFDDATASLRKGEITAGPVSLQNGKVAIASVTDVQAGHPASFDEAKTEVHNKASQEKLNKVVNDKANELVEKAKSMDGDLAKAAKAMGIEVKTSADVDRQGAIESVGTASMLPDAFTKPVGSIIGPSQVTGGKVVAKILSQTPANIADLPAQSASIRDELKQQKSRDRAQVFVDGLRERLKADGKLKINQDIVNQIVQSYNTKS